MWMCERLCYPISRLSADEGCSSSTCKMTSSPSSSRSPRCTTLRCQHSEVTHTPFFLSLCGHHSLHSHYLPTLEILEGSGGSLNNYNLCHIKTIKWEKEIITGPGSKFVYVYNFSEPERDCPPCHKSCEAGCWGEGGHNCQKFSKMNCAAECDSGRCFGPLNTQCCHFFCVGGCSGPKESDCLVRDVIV